MLRRILAVLAILAAIPSGAGVVESKTNVSYGARVFPPVGGTFVATCIPSASDATTLICTPLTFNGTNITLASGQLLLPAGTAALPAWAFAADPDTGVWNSAANTLAFSVAGSSQWFLNAGNFFPASTGTKTLGGPSNRIASGLFGGQTLTTTVTPLWDGSVTWNDAGTTHQGIKLAVTKTAAAAASTVIDLQVDASSVFKVTAAGAGTFASSLTISGNVSGANIFAGSHNVGSSTRGYWNWLADGVITALNNAGTNFSRLQLGGTTSSFPSLKRDNASIIVRLADDSADTTIRMHTPIVTGTSSPASGASCTTGTITWDASYIYVCTASTVWKRSALTGGY